MFVYFVSVKCRTAVDVEVSFHRWMEESTYHKRAVVPKGFKLRPTL